MLITSLSRTQIYLRPQIVTFTRGCKSFLYNVGTRNLCITNRYPITTQHNIVKVQGFKNVMTIKPPQNIQRYKCTKVSEGVCTNKEASKDASPPTVPLTRAEKLKKAVKDYGATVIVFHISISLISLGSFYLLVKTGLDVDKVLSTLGLTEWATKNNIATHASTFAVAYAIHKVFTPVRMAITLTSVPFIVRHLRKIGFLKK